MCAYLFNQKQQFHFILNGPKNMNTLELMSLTTDYEPYPNTMNTQNCGTLARRSLRFATATPKSMQDTEHAGATRIWFKHQEMRIGYFCLSMTDACRPN